MRTLEGLELETLLALQAGERLLKEQRAVLERELDKLDWLLRAVEEGQRRLARIRDVRNEIKSTAGR